MNANQTIPLPTGPCYECCDTGVPTLSNGALVWCEHTGYGGHYDPSTGRWSIQGPFTSLPEYVRSLYDSCACVFHADDEAEEMHGGF